MQRTLPEHVPGLAPDPFEPLACDTSRRFVRVTEERSDGLVAFDFAIGWPELSVELLLPRTAFDTFCQTNRVIRLAPHPPTPPHPADDNPEETDQ